MATLDTLLADVKHHLSISTDDDDINANIKLKINAICAYLINGGANLEGTISDNTVSCIAIGVNDLLNSTAGGTKFSPAFNMLAQQVCRGGK